MLLQCSGNVLVVFWHCVGRDLGTCWLCVGRVLGQGMFDGILAMRLRYVGGVLVMISRCVDDASVIFLSCSGYA